MHHNNKDKIKMQKSKEQKYKPTNQQNIKIRKKNPHLQKGNTIFQNVIERKETTHFPMI